MWRERPRGGPLRRERLRSQSANQSAEPPTTHRAIPPHCMVAATTPGRCRVVRIIPALCSKGELLRASPCQELERSAPGCGAARRARRLHPRTGVAARTDARRNHALVAQSESLASVARPAGRRDRSAFGRHQGVRRPVTIAASRPRRPDHGRFGWQADLRGAGGFSAAARPSRLAPEGVLAGGRISGHRDGCLRAWVARCGAAAKRYRNVLFRALCRAARRGRGQRAPCGASDMQLEFADGSKQRARDRRIAVGPSQVMVRLERMEACTEQRIGRVGQVQRRALPNHDPAQRDARAPRIA